MVTPEEVVDELLERMKNPTLSEESFNSLAHRIEVLRGLDQK